MGGDIEVQERIRWNDGLDRLTPNESLHRAYNTRECLWISL